MGVYIKGMEMPESCFDCVLNHNFFRDLGCGRLAGMCGFRNDLPHTKDRHKDCPLVPVPDHGDLIEANSLKIRLGQRFSLDERRIMEIVRETVDTAKVVIPAERREE